MVAVIVRSRSEKIRVEGESKTLSLDTARKMGRNVNVAVDILIDNDLNKHLDIYCLVYCGV
jgi:2-phospho-L-lactate guanylyltransferase (CobY/MobA/RfbA family)